MPAGAIIQRAFEIDVGAEPISGRITAAGQPPREFVGWFELFVAIEELRGSASTLSRAPSGGGASE